MKRFNSETIISQKAPHSKTGTQGGGRGLATPESLEKVAAWLASHSVQDVDRAAVSRAKSHGVGLQVRIEYRYPSGPNGEYLPSYGVAAGCDVHGDNESRAAALADLLNFQTPAPIRTIEDWLAELSVISASRSREEIESALMVTAYSSRLSQYPADIVREALLVKAWKWWPTWDELRKECEAKAGPRRHMIAALQKPEPDPEPVRRAPTQEERDRIQAMVDEMFPNRDAAMRKAAVDEALKGNCMTGDAA